MGLRGPQPQMKARDRAATAGSGPPHKPNSASNKSKRKKQKETETMSAQDDAVALVDTFASNDRVGTVWVNINKNDVVAGLKSRIGNPDNISQKGSLNGGGTSLCGPADFVR